MSSASPANARIAPVEGAERSSPPLVLLHGFMGSRADWARVTKALEGAITVVALDLPGHGTSVGLRPEAYALQAAADRVLEQAPTLPFHLAGYSMGGRVAMHAALRDVGRIRSLTLVSAHTGLPTPSEREARLAADRGLASSLTTGFGAWLEAWLDQPLFATLTAAQKRALHQERLTRCDPEELARVLAGLSTGLQRDLCPDLRQLEVPVQAVAGSLDAKYCQVATALRREVRVVEGAGHNLPLEAPKTLATVIGDFCRRVDMDPGTGR